MTQGLIGAVGAMGEIAQIGETPKIRRGSICTNKNQRRRCSCPGVGQVHEDALHKYVISVFSDENHEGKLPRGRN